MRNIPTRLPPDPLAATLYKCNTDFKSQCFQCFYTIKTKSKKESHLLIILNKTAFFLHTCITQAIMSHWVWYTVNFVIKDHHRKSKFWSFGTDGLLIKVNSFVLFCHYIKHGWSLAQCWLYLNSLGFHKIKLNLLKWKKKTNNFSTRCLVFIVVIQD